MSSKDNIPHDVYYYPILNIDFEVIKGCQYLDLVMGASSPPPESPRSSASITPLA